MESTINERLRLLIEKLNCNISEFAEVTKIKQTSLSTALIRSKTLSSQILNNIIISFPKVNIGWLITGQGEMFNSKSTELITKPRIPFSASAGFLTSSMNGITIGECEKVPVINSFPTYDYTILVKGESMHPEIKSGDEVACKRIDENRFIQWGRIHVLDTTQGVVIKKIYDENEGIRCVSTNSDYKDFVIPKEDIYSISLVVGLLRL